MTVQTKSGLVVLAFVTLGWSSSGLGQSTQQTSQPTAQQQGVGWAGALLPGRRLSGTIRGTVVDQTGALVAGAQARLSGEDEALDREVQSASDGQFSFPNVAPGPFQLTVTSTGFSAQTFSGILHSAETEKVPQFTLSIATAVTDVQVRLTQVEVAEEQIRVEEKQRVLGAIPNFYVTYVPNAAPLTPKQKFELAWKTVLDPVTFIVVGGIAGLEQAQNHFIGYGQGAQGYAKRFGAGYADTVTGTFIGSAILASLLKQDPRYFYKGTGGTRARILYAIANSVICKGDNGRWQANYSNIFGNLASGGISNLYYPAQDRSGAELTFENGAIGIGAGAFTNLLQEFVLRKLTPEVHNPDPGKP